MDDFNTYEYTAAQKPEGKWKARRLLMLLAYALYSATYLTVILITKVIPLGALIPVTLWIIVYFTWGFVNPEYKYLIEKGTLTYFVIYGNKKKELKAKMSFKVSYAEAIAPRAEIEALAKELADVKVFSAIPSVSAADQYGALYKDEEGQYCIFYFVATSQALKLLRFYNSKTVVTQTAI